MRHAATGASADLDALRNALGVSLHDEILTLALTHRSYAYEHGGVAHNERLEFLGDSILGQAVTVRLFTDNPDLPEGELAKRRASLVSSVALAEIAGTIGLGRYIRLGRGEDTSGGRHKASILADTVEAIIGATYLDAGDDVATDLVLRLVTPLMRDPARFGAAMDPKTSLQERVAQLGGEAPEYEVVGTGPDHDRTFHATVTVPGVVVGRGEGSSKKHAEMAAALEAFALLNDAAGGSARDDA
ncbi:MAG TPA: ribonuclease III [Microbacteriaceae bacterium]|nr:ribonuclease III [Microbacteriaceae bacterium]